MTHLIVICLKCLGGPELIALEGEGCCGCRTIPCICATHRQTIEDAIAVCEKFLHTRARIYSPSLN
jgi:hypothetical protein